MRLTLLLSLLPATLAAQATDTAKVAHPIPVTDSVLRLPVDHASDLLPWMAGGGLDPDGRASWHGFRAQSLDRVTDGIRWASGLRSTGLRGSGAALVTLEPDLNALDRAELSSSGRGPFAFQFTTARGGDHWRANGSGESEDPVRAQGGSGFSRFEGDVGGPLPGGFRIRAAGTLLGRRSAPTGVDYAASPYYVPSGIDTIMRVPNNDVLTDTTDVPVLGFRSTSAVPFSPLSTADWAVRLDGKIMNATLWAHWLGTRVAERTFSYLDVTNPIQARGADRSGRDLAAGVTIPLVSGVTVEGAVSLQHERSEQGPLTSAADAASRDPALGLMLGGLDLRFDLDNFPVNDELVANYRNNTPGSRRSPYDLENTAQYALIDQYRNDAYGLLGWSEEGGPVGLLAFDQDSRLFATAAVTIPLVGGQRIKVGAEMVHHDMQHYSHNLTSQAFSDVWLEKPVESALLADWTWNGRGWRLTAGARLDRFNAGASRMYLLDTVSGSPTVGQYQYFPRISSYGKNDPLLQRLVPDHAHSAFSPHLAASKELGDGWALRLSATRSARMPDLAYLYAGVNTDLAITNSNHSYGTDMGHEISDLYEFGISRHFREWVVDAAFFDDARKAFLVNQLAFLYDPARGTNRDIPLTTVQKDGGSYRGVTVGAVWQATPWLRSTGTYRYAETGGGWLGPFDQLYPADYIRPNTLALTTAIEGPRGSLFSGFGALITYRTMSGAAHAVDPGVGPIFPGGLTVVSGIPSWRSLDLRVSKALTVGSKQVTIFADGRNLFNAANLLRAFWTGDPLHASFAEQIEWSNDSSATADEAIRSGHYDLATGNIDLTFGGAGRGGCGAWVTANGESSSPNCAYLIAAEQRFGDGDGVYTLTEQHSASMAYYRTLVGRNAFTGPGRAIRIGAQVAF